MNISTGASLVPLIRIDAIVEWLLGKYVNKSWWCGAFSSAGNHGCPLPFIFLTDIGTWSLRASRNHMAGKIIAIMLLLSAVELQTGADWGTHRDSVFETGGSHRNGWCLLECVKPSGRMIFSYHLKLCTILRK